MPLPIVPPASEIDSPHSVSCYSVVHFTLCFLKIVIENSITSKQKAGKQRKLNFILLLTVQSVLVCYAMEAAIL